MDDTQRKAMMSRVNMIENRLVKLEDKVFIVDGVLIFIGIVLIALMIFG